MKKLLPLILLLIGSGAGVGAGIFLRPEPEIVELTENQDAQEEASKGEQPLASETDGSPSGGMEYIKLSNQFVVPIVQEDRISAMVVMTLSIEAVEGKGEEIYDKEPKLRDVILRVLFDHANIGGFDGEFTNNNNLDVLRRALREVSQKTLGSDVVNDVLIFEIARQDY